MKNQTDIAPLLKWVGGKRQLLHDIRQFLPKDPAGYYCEPFFGGGALFFSLLPEKAVISDYNGDLMNVYEVVRDQPEKLIADLKKHENTPEYYYRIRALDRSPEFTSLSAVEKASRFIFLNRTCYNGLYRVNAAGQFNSPYGRYRNPNIVNEPGIRIVSRFLASRNVQIQHGDYEVILSELPSNAFAYLDPPYHPLSRTSSFTAYVRGGWTEQEQLRLRRTCETLSRKGIRFLLSNSSCQFIKDLYSEYHIHTVLARRSVNSDSSRRGQVQELLICNY